jgi:hypothetical protein
MGAIEHVSEANEADHRPSAIGTHFKNIPKQTSLNKESLRHARQSDSL